MMSRNQPRGRLLTTLTVLSAVLAIAVLVCWHRSYRRCDVLIKETKREDHVEVTSEFGVMVLEVETAQRGVTRPEWCYFESSLPRRFGADSGLLGFACYTGVKRHFLLLPAVRFWGMAVPYWFAALATAALPMLRLVRWRRGLALIRTRVGCCRVCGYDLRATPDRCPECGNVIGA